MGAFISVGSVNTGTDQAVAGILSSAEGSVCIGTVECSQWGQGKMAFIIRGDEWIDENETCWIWRSYGMEVMDGQIVYRNVLNLMQDGTYLIFLNSNVISDLRDSHLYISILSENEMEGAEWIFVERYWLWRERISND